MGDFNRYFPKEDTQITDKHMKKMHIVSHYGNTNKPQ